MHTEAKGATQVQTKVQIQVVVEVAARVRAGPRSSLVGSFGIIAPTNAVPPIK